MSNVTKALATHYNVRTIPSAMRKELKETISGNEKVSAIFDKWEKKGHPVNDRYHIWFTA